MGDRESSPRPGPSGSDPAAAATSQDKVLEYSILDIPGISYEDEDGENDETLVKLFFFKRCVFVYYRSLLLQRMLARAGLGDQSNSSVSAVPSGSGMTFMLDADDEDADNPIQMIPKDFGKRKKKLNVIEDDDSEDCYLPNDIVGITVAASTPSPSVKPGNF